MCNDNTSNIAARGATSRRRPWGDTPVCVYCGRPATATDGKSGARLCASCAERLRLIRIIKAMLRRRGDGGCDRQEGGL